MKCPKRLRKIMWILHEFISPLGHVVWLEHRIVEIEEAIAELERLSGDC